MANVVFTHQVGDPTSTNPISLVLSLTAAGVDLRTIGTNGYGRTVKYVGFNGIASGDLTSELAVLSANEGTIIRVDGAYNGVQFGIVFDDNTSSLFTAATATSRQTLTNNGYNTIVPEKQRLWNLMND